MPSQFLQKVRPTKKKKNFPLGKRFFLFREYHQEETEGGKKTWSEEEEQVLIDLHNQLGNKWTDISSKLYGK